MGKGIDNKKLVKRSEKVAFMEIIDENKTSIFELMEGFTDMAFSKNPKEYSRGYVDEDTDRTDLTGYAESISYTLDRYKGQAAAEEIVKITEEELTGSDALRRIIVVDKTTTTGHGNGILRAQARIRAYTVVPDSNGGSRDCIECIRRHGKLRVWKADNSVVDGIRDTAVLLKLGRLQFCECCKDTIREFGLYRWDEKSQKDAVIKENDHAMDETRYFVRTVMRKYLKRIASEQLEVITHD